MRRLAPIVPLALALVALSAHAQDEARIEPTEGRTISLPIPGGWAMSPDGEMLIISAPSTAELIFVDTVRDRIARRLRMDFQPGALALHGASLCAIGKGSSLIYVLDPTTGRIKRTVRLPGIKPIRLAAHPSKGPLFAATDTYAVLSINTDTGQVMETPAQGNFFAVSAQGDYLYTGTQKPIQKMLVLRRGPGRSLQANIAHRNGDSYLAKYAIEPGGLKPLAVNPGAAMNGHELAVSPDGKKVAIAGGGGIQGGDGKRVYAIPVYDAEDLETQLGQVEIGAYPTNISFHPVLDLGVAEKSDGELTLFNTRSLATVGTIPAPPRAGHAGEAILLTFGGRGTKLLFYRSGPGALGSPPPAAARSRTRAITTRSPAKAASHHELPLRLIPLDLTDEDRAKLARGSASPKRQG